MMDKLQEALKACELKYTHPINIEGEKINMGVLIKAAQAYADFPAKIEGKRKKLRIKPEGVVTYGDGYNQAFDDILNLIKEQQNDK